MNPTNVATTSRRRTFLPTMLSGVLVAALAAVASAKDWASLQAAASHQVQSSITSSAELPLASALSLAALASWGALLVSRGRWRRWIAALGLALAVGSLATAIVGFSKAPHDLRAAVHNALGNAVAVQTSLNGWYWTALIADLLVVIALTVAVRDAPQWPAMSARYDAPTTSGGASRASKPLTTQLDVWKAMDQGTDPTLDPDPPVEAGPTDEAP